MSIPIYQVDSFSGHCFQGNPAAVCVLDQPTHDAAWMQALAGEMNLSETAFIEPFQDDAGCFPLRWFTPLAEVDLCGHATLAAAHIMWTTERVAVTTPIRFITRSGVLEVHREAEQMTMDFPAKPARPAQAPAGLLESLGLSDVDVYSNHMDYLVEVDQPQTLRELEPDFARLRQVEARGVIVTCASDLGEFDFLSRFFAPRVGVDEDPVTGSAHCCLGPFWSEKLHRKELIGYQASTRGGSVGVICQGDRVRLIGEAVTVFAGTLASPAHPAH